MIYSLLAMLVIAVLMFVSVKSLPATIAILLNLPLALVGGLVAILLTGGCSPWPPDRVHHPLRGGGP